MAEESAEEKKVSAVETMKLESRGLASNLKEQYENPENTHFDETGYQLMKFHGSYQQDDRDVRTERRRAKLDKAWMFMIRAKIPGGQLKPEHYLAMDRMATQYCNDTLRLTSRQSIQFHGIGWENLKAIMKELQDETEGTQGACGDINRNTMCCPVADLDWRHKLGMQAMAHEIAEHFKPHSTAIYEVFCDGERFGEKVEVNREEPIYGPTYLPRKFKIAVVVPEDNCVDLYSQDASVEIVHENGEPVAYDIVCGGGMGFSHGAEKTYPRLGTRMFRCAREQVIPVLEAVVKAQRDNGDRTDRKQARLKYTIDRMGVDGFKQAVFAHLGYELPEAGPAPAKYGNEDHLGWHEQHDGNLYVGLHVQSGRVADTDAYQWKTGLREIVSKYRLPVRLTGRQNLILVGIAPGQKDEIQALLDQHGLRTDIGIQRMRRLSIACPALPTCGLALAESERYIPRLLDDLEARGVGDKDVEIRMTGCPNSCVRTPEAEIGIIGRGPSRYAIYLGGNQQNTQLAWEYAPKVLESDVAPLIERLVTAWDEATGGTLGFGEWATQQGGEALAQYLPAEG